ncbi:hypothetical protein GC170_18610 [bacterium]|nr:hypothetical protein [bacterium]
MNSLPDRFRLWFEHERDSNAKTLAMLESVPEDQRPSPDYRKALDRMGHIVAARRRWLFRLAGTPDVEGIFPTGAEIGSLRNDVVEMERLWIEYLTGLDDVELQRELEWVAINGKRYRWNVEGALTQMYGHAFYHRGQIAQTVAQLGGKSVDTDYIYWMNLEPLAPA